MKSHMAFRVVGAMLLCAADATTQAADRAPHQVRWLTRGDARLEHLDFGGAASRTIVLVPGYGDNAHIFDDLAPVLARRFHVVALTPRGHGASSTPMSGYTVRSFADDLGALLDTLQVQRAVLVGHSAAGATITDFAARHSERTQGVVYLDATLDLARRDSVLAANPIQRPAPTDSTPDGARRWYREVFYGFWSDAIENAMRSRSSETAARSRSTLLPQFLHDVATHQADYHKVRAPALIITTTKTVDANYPWLRVSADTTVRATAQRYLDAVLNPWYAAGARRAQRDLPRSRTVVLSGHHYIFVTSESRVANEIFRFAAAAASGSKRQPANDR